MKKHLAALPLFAFATACSEGAVSPLIEAEGGPSEIVITQGVVAPVARPFPLIPMKSDLAGSTLGSSQAAFVTLKPVTCSSGNSDDVVVTFSVTGNQAGTATFDVHSVWTFNGTTWVGSSPTTTVSVDPRAGGDDATALPVTLTLVNASSESSGVSLVTAPAFNLTNSNNTGAKLDLKSASAKVYVAFASCPVANTAPWVNVPDDFGVEATSAAGAIVNYAAQVTVGDLEDDAADLSLVCTPDSGSQFALGPTEVTCTVTDTGGMQHSASFTITIVDTTPPAFTTFPSDETRIAQNINGWAFDLSSFDIVAEDVGGVSEPSTFECDVATGAMLVLGGPHWVSCTATDAVGNESAPQLFQIVVTLDLTGVGFLTPLREVEPFSAHKLGSTVPHKFPAPKYADGTLATDLAAGLRLVLSRVGGGGTYDTQSEDDYSAGSTDWRWDEASQHYIYNVKTPKTGWSTGTYETTASYAGVTLAQTMLELRR